MRAYELSAGIAANGQLVWPDLQLDAASEHTQVRVIVLVEETSELNNQDWLASAAKNPAFDFLHDPEEDVYTLNDGVPFEY